MSLIPITNDLYDIAWRLASVDGDYRLYYNADKGRYEVYSAARCSLQFILPFDELDARAVEYARSTRVERAEEIFRETERCNAEIERDSARRLADCVAAIKEIS